MRRRPGLRLSGIGGPAMRAAGVQTWFDVADLEVVGVLEVVRRLPVLRRAKGRILQEVGARGAEAAVLIDFPGFNLHLAKRLHARGLKVIYFVAPQLWAWGRWRARAMARSVDKLLVILPFEVGFFRDLGIETEFVGNPLIDSWEMEPVEAARERLGLAESRPVIGVLPGSREREVAAILPPMLEAVRILRAAYPQARFLLPVAETLPWEGIARRAQEAGVRPVRGARDVLRASDAAMVASGTATLEAGILGTPSVLAYHLHPITFSVVRWMANLPTERFYFGLVNILAGEALFPELLQEELRPENLALEAKRLLEDKERTAYVKRRLRDIRRSLGAGGCFERATEAIVESLEA